MGEARQFLDIYIANQIPTSGTFAMVETALSWYALKVRSGSEEAVANALRFRGYNPYCPTQKERRRYSDRLKVIDKPLFPGYVFCLFDILKKLPIVSCPGVDYIVNFAGVAVPIPDIQMDNVQRMAKAGAVASKPCVMGDRVRVMYGPLEGVEGVLVRESKGNRLVVSIELLQRATSLFINEDQISPVS